ncbi:class III lanthionine synthetase LanKC [Shouchella lonarensis]|uniref:Protein kinase domain-containing protein n=1 Tax=Shouchella lonarensis TaxID=1464122 RepID=A0A1G6PFU5_9BACI|nr:class III lanthionine synthetase LanKC [Shouchella lonarensis]SDC78225.1 Protein kinase domain-containing protein [Shouchella lonarensis]
MKDDMLYHNYLKQGSEYYEPYDKFDSTKEFYVDSLKSDWTVIDDENSIWRYYECKDKSLPDQGWKIHVSSTMNDAEQILKDVREVLIQYKVAFKHIKNKEILLNMNDKSANRGSSGKFIAIYPKDDSEFLFLLDALREKIQSYEKGPYILNDKRWKDSNVYYRYGGFSSMYNDKGELCVKDDQGNLVIDERTPFYQVPEFVKEFDEHLDSLNDSSNDEGEGDNKLNLYKIQTSLCFTNSGGIYLAERKTDNKKVIIKEARPKAGLDGHFVDAVERQKIERNALKKLSNVTGVVDVLDDFKMWEHYFLVEEYVEGQDLYSWIERNYPVMKDLSINDYKLKLKKILPQLVKIVEEMHDRNIAMDDLQPANIMISEDFKVTLVDFETAKKKTSQEKPGMATTGFVSSKIKTSGARDWYALQKIVRFSLLPILSSEEVDEYLNDYYYKWVKEFYDKDFYQFIGAILQKCNKHLVNFGEEITLFNNMDANDVRRKSISSIIESLKKGIEDNFTEDMRLINGDIRQYEYNDGKLNVLNGGAGAALAFVRTGNVNNKVNEWIEQYLMNNTNTVETAGLLTGKAGIGSVLYEFGYKEESLTMFTDIENNLDHSDVSLRSGLAGVGLALSSLYLERMEETFLAKAESLAKMIDGFIEGNKELIVQDWSGSPIGLIDGWSGVSMFYSALYSLTGNRKYYLRSLELIVKDLKRTVEDKDLEVLNTIDDNNRLLSFLSGGSIGVGVAISYLNHVSEEKVFQEELRLITNLSKMRSTINGSLFDGAGSLLLVPPMIGGNDTAYESKKDDVLELLNLFLVEKKDYLSFPGYFSFRLSDDLSSGSAGIILALEGILKDNPLYWLPVVNIDRFYRETKFKREPLKVMV